MIRKRFNALKPHLDERMRRLVAAAEAKALGHGGITAVSRATGLSRNTVARGMAELEGQPVLSAQRTRQRGGGRKRQVEKDPTLMRDLGRLTEPQAQGEDEPVSSLQWTCKSLRGLADELKKRGHATSHRMVGELLHQEGYRCHGRALLPRGFSRQERCDGFERIHQRIAQFHRNHQPVVAVEMKKWEFQDRSSAAEILPQQDRPSEWIPATVDRTTCTLAAESVRRWWTSRGSRCYPEADALLLTAEGAGGGLYRTGWWKKALQDVADTSGLSLTVLRFPAGIHRWNGIKDRTVSCFRQERHHGPCTEHEVVVSWIAGPEEPHCLDKAPDPTGPHHRPEENQPPENIEKNRQAPKEENLGVWGFVLPPRPPKTH